MKDGDYFGEASVIREMSAIVEYIMNQAVHDMDVVLSREVGISAAPGSGSDSSGTPIMEMPAGSDR